jgi:hypothetical protein
MTSKMMDDLKYKFTYDEKIHIDKINMLSYYNNFINIEVDDIICNCSQINHCDNILNVPEIVTHLTIAQRYEYNNQNIIIPFIVTHLTIDYWLDVTLKFHALPKITHLTFDKSFDRSIIDRIPNSVTHLVFGRKFNRPIKDIIPNSVTHLKFGFCFNQPIKDYIPESVVHLTFGYAFKQSLDNLPASIIYLALSRNYDSPINGQILSKIRVDNLFC